MSMDAQTYFFLENGLPDNLGSSSSPADSDAPAPLPPQRTEESARSIVAFTRRERPANSQTERRPRPVSGGPRRPPSPGQRSPRPSDAGGWKSQRRPDRAAGERGGTFSRNRPA